MRKLTFGLATTLSWVLTSTAWAQDPTASTEAAPAAAAKPAAPAAAAKPADGVKRDPRGVKGISPFWELILKGDRAYVARDLDGALAAYREAQKLEPQNAAAHYRLGEVQLAKGDQKEAEAAFVAGTQCVGKDATLRAKLIFALADLRERQQSSDDAISRWQLYAKVAVENKEAVAYPATATERINRNEAWKKTLADSTAVKARIEKRLKEGEAAARKSAADPKNK